MGAAISGQIERAEEKGFREGYDEGLKEGRETTEKLFISKLLEHYTTEEISKEFEIPHERVIKIKENLITILNEKLLRISSK